MLSPLTQLVSASSQFAILASLPHTTRTLHSLRRTCASLSATIKRLRASVSAAQGTCKLAGRPSPLLPPARLCARGSQPASASSRTPEQPRPTRRRSPRSAGRCSLAPRVFSRRYTRLGPMPPLSFSPHINTGMQAAPYRQQIGTRKHQNRRHPDGASMQAPPPALAMATALKPGRSDGGTPRACRCSTPPPLPAHSGSSGGLLSTPSRLHDLALPHSGSSDSLQALLLVAHVHRLQAMQAPRASTAPAQLARAQKPQAAPSAARHAACQPPGARGPAARAASSSHAPSLSRLSSPSPARSPSISSSGSSFAHAAAAPRTPSHAEARATLNLLFTGDLSPEERRQLQAARAFLAAF